MRRKSALLWVLVLSLTSLGLGLALHKNRVLGVSLLPGAEEANWTIEATVDFDAQGKPVVADLALPGAQLDSNTQQNVASLGYGYQERMEGNRRRGVWSASQREGSQRLYYQITLPEKTLRKTSAAGRTPPKVEPIDVGGSEAERAARRILLADIREKSGDRDTFVQLLRARIFDQNPTQEGSFLRRSYENRIGDTWAMVLLQDILQAEGIPYRNAWGVVLNSELGAQQPVRVIEYFDGRQWQQTEAEEGREPGEVAIWSRGSSLLDLTGGTNSQVLFTAQKNLAPMNVIEALRAAPPWVGSIAALPLRERGVFRYIALIPIGAFVIVFLRNFIGFNMLGTFMPVLLALSFLEIPLGPALFMFSALLAAGLAFRFLLNRLNLLVVPRVAACVVIVSLLMILFGLFSYRLGIQLGLQVTVFPMVVLAWTIERMSMLWDEEGAKPALMQAGGSLLAAVLAFLIMQMRIVNYWAIYFPELLLILLAGILLIGRYTGYRVSELFRFKNFPSPA